MSYQRKLISLAGTLGEHGFNELVKIIDKEASNLKEPWQRTLLDLLVEGARRYGPTGFQMAQEAALKMLDGDDSAVRKVTKNLLIASNLLVQLQNAEADRKDRARKWLMAFGQVLGTILKTAVKAIL